MKTIIDEFKIEHISERTTKISYDRDSPDLVRVYEHIGHSDAVIPSGHLRIIEEKGCVKGIWNFPLDYFGDEFYGLGDKSGPVNRRGGRFSMYNKDALAYDARYSDPLYKSVPFFMRKNSSNGEICGYYFPCSEIEYVDFGRESPLYYSVCVKDGPFCYYRIEGKDESEILSSYYELTGKPYFPPLYSFGYFGSSMNYVEPDDAEQRILEFFRKVEEKKIPCEGMYLSSGYVKHSDGKRYTFMWNKDKFPDPEKFFTDLENRGYRFTENIKPGFLTTHPLYDELDKKGYFVKGPDGKSVVEYYWGGNASFIDFANKEAVSWWKAMLKAQPCSGVWNDNNELEIEDPDVPWSKNRINYPVLMAKAAYEAKTEQYPGERPWIYSRAGTSGLQQYARTWTGDNTSTFEALEFNQYMGINLGLSGIPFYGHDLGGFFGPPPSEKLLREACKSGVLQSRFVIHSWRENGEPTEPWTYPDAEWEIVNRILEHYEYLPYIYSSAYNAVKCSVPMERIVSGGILFGNCILKRPDFSFEYIPGSAIPLCRRRVKNSSEIFRELEIHIEPLVDGSVIHESVIFADDGISDLSLGKYTELRVTVLENRINIQKIALGYDETEKISFIFPGFSESYFSFMDIPDFIEF